MLKRLAAVLLLGAVYFTSALAWPSPAGAQVISQRVAACDPSYPNRCIKPNADGSINVSGSSGGGTTVTATANAPTYVEASDDNPVSSDLHGSLRTTILDDAGIAVDWTAAVPVTQSGAWNITNVTGTVSLPTGAATEASLVKVPLAQGSTTSGQSGALIQGAVTTAAPTYTTAQTSPLSLTTGGALRVDVGSAGFTATGPTADDAAATGNPLQVAGKYTATAPTFTDGDTAQLRLTPKGQLIVGGATADDAAAPSAADSYPLSVGGKYNASLPTYTDGDRTQLQFTSKGTLATTLYSSTGNLLSAGAGGDGATIASQGLRTNSIPAISNGTTADVIRSIGGSFGSATGVMAVEQAGSPFAYIGTATTTQVKSGAGILHKVVVNTCVASATIDLIDNTSGSTINIGRITCGSTTDGTQRTYDLAFATGLRVITSGATDVTVVYR